jgi:type II secretory ATPase GspE/PulE/Tfp pilus assembly ATPase PilB-like protein
MTVVEDDYPLLVVDEALPPDQAFALLLERAVDLGASDLFLAAHEDRVAVEVRHLGIMHLLSNLPRQLGQHCIGHIKAMAGLDIAEHRRPLDGRWLHRLADGGQIDLRVTTLPTIHGEDCSVRLLARDLCLLPLEELGMIRKELNDLLAMLNCPSGLVLVTGPTGAGKTTTLYACLSYLNNGHRKINTIEDPIEYEIQGVRQSQVNPRIDLGFAELLRSVLRQAPDVIMVGEVRDPETATTVVQAANSGQLVLATLHAPVATTAVQSMRAYGVHAHFLASSLVGVIAQRLIRTLCPACRTPYALTDSQFPFEDIHPLLAPGEGQSLWSARGCPACHGTGYSGRTGVFEVLRVSQALRRLIAQGQPISKIREQAVREGMIELRQAALLKVAQGQTTAEEVVRAVPAEFLGLEE